MIAKEEKLSVTRQCALLDLNRSSVYYKPVPLKEKDRELMRQIDEIHLNYPFYGSRNIRNELWSRGYAVSRDRVRRLMRQMGIEALYIKPKLSWRNPQHTRYPYLLRNIEITQANHVWCADITYISMARGFCYLFSIMDWSSRLVLSWKLFNTLDSSFCVEALEEAITKYGCPEIFNTDQGSQFTAEEFTDTLRVFFERLWKSVKYEDIYLKAYSSMTEARNGLSQYLVLKPLKEMSILPVIKFGENFQRSIEGEERKFY
jgi:putative transposase